MVRRFLISRLQDLQELDILLRVAEKLNLEITGNLEDMIIEVEIEKKGRRNRTQERKISDTDRDD